MTSTLSSPSKAKLHTVRDVKKELFDWRRYYATEIEHGASLLGNVSSGGASFLEGVTRDDHTAVKLHQLPADAAVIILTYLSQKDIVLSAGLVSRGFHSMTKHPVLWKTFNLPHLVRSSQLPVAAPGVTRSFSADEKGNFWIRQLVDGKFSKPGHVELQTCTMSKRTVRQIFTAADKATFADFSYCDGIDNETLEQLCLTPPFLPTDAKVVLGKSVSEGTQSIQSLRLAFCCSFDSPTLSCLLNQTQWLHSLDISGCDHLCADEMGAVLSACSRVSRLRANVTKIAAESWQLVSTELSLTSLSLVSTKTDDVSLDLIAQKCPRLEELLVSSCPVSDSGLKTFVEGLRHTNNIVNLKELFVDGCVSVTDSGLVAVLHRCPHMRRLSIDRTKGSLGAVECALDAPSLHHLSVVGCLHLRRDLQLSYSAKNKLMTKKRILTKESTAFLFPRR